MRRAALKWHGGCTIFRLLMSAPEITLEAVSSISAISAAEWDACANPGADSGAASNPYYNPFVSHAFFAAAEASGSAAPRSGWGARHLIAKLDECRERKKISH